MSSINSEKWFGRLVFRQKGWHWRYRSVGILLDSDWLEADRKNGPATIVGAARLTNKTTPIAPAKNRVSSLKHRDLPDSRSNQCEGSDER